MRFDSVFDALYLAGALWGGLTGPQRCPTTARTPFPPKASAAATAFVDVNVVPMDSELVLEKQVVVVESGRITALGPTNKVAIPAGAVRVDGRGKYLMPGLTDMHAHLHFYGFGFDEAAATRYMFSYLAHGVTGVRQLNTAGPEPEMFRRFQRGEVLSPRLYIAPSIAKLHRPTVEDGQPQPNTSRPDSVAAYLAAAKAQGYDFIDIADHYAHVRAGESRALLDSVLVVAHRLGLPLASHTNRESFQDMLKFGAYGASVEHFYAFNDTLGATKTVGVWREVPITKVQTAAAATKRAGTWITVTLDCVADRNKTPGITAARQLVKALQDAGVGLLLGADSDRGHGQATSGVHEELAELVRAGLTPYQALLTGTRNVAQYFAKLDSAGTVAVGKRADLVLLYKNPLVNIRHAIEPAGVMIRGQWLDRAALDRGLLSDPKYWLTTQIANMMPRLVESTVRPHVEQFESLADSLVHTESASADHARLIRLLTEELAALRPLLTPEQQEIFDPEARAWMREQGRRGHQVEVAGVTPIR